MKRREIDYDLLYEENDSELQDMLKYKKYTYVESGNRYEGQWFYGFRHGKGLMRFNDGATYEGDWNVGYAQGYGKFTNQIGETYEGDWVDNMRHGKGISIH